MNIVTKNYESLLPFLVVEAISARDLAFRQMSVRMIDKGWAWLVSGRKLLIWKFKETKSASVVKARRMLSPCFELQLPQSDLAHRADLINVFFMPQNLNTSIRTASVPAAIFISPEGTMRFWSNITNERFTESSVCDSQSQEFCVLAPLSSLDYLLGTTTGSVYLLTIDVKAHDPKSILLCSSLSIPSGLLSGIGRRVSNLFFGPLTNEVNSNARSPLIAVPKYSQSTIDKTGTTDRPFFILSSNCMLRQWSRTNEGSHSTNQIIKEWDLQRNIYLRIIQELELSDSNMVNFWPIDLITTKAKELLILIVISDSTRSNAIHYATCIFNPYQAGDDIASLTLLRSHSWQYSSDSEDQLFALRFLERRTTSNLCFMYDRKFLFLVQVDKDILDAIDYGNQEDGIIGAGMIDSHPILFTQRDGLIYVAPVISDKSRLNDTSLQLEPPTPVANRNANRSNRDESMRHHQTSINVEPAIIEMDEDNENEAPGPANLTTQNPDMSQTTANRSLDQSTMNKSTDQSTRKKDSIADIIRDNKEFEWVSQIDNREYQQASNTLAILAQQSELLKDRRETLLALSELSKSAV